MSFTNKIARQCEEWWRDHAGRHYDPAWQSWLADFADLSRRKIDEQSREHDNRGRFGMSKAGGCTRAVALRLLGAPEEELSGSTRFTFWIGHQVEIMALATLKSIGLLVSASTEDGVQWRAAIDPYMLSYSDAVLVRPTQLMGVASADTVVSIKSASFKMSGKLRDGSWKRYGFAQYPMDGVKATNPNYWAQMQAEMAGTGTERALFVVVAKDMIKAMEGDPILSGENGSLSFYAEMVERDERFIEGKLKPMWSGRWELAQAGDPGDPYYLAKSGEYVRLDPLDRAKDGPNKKATGSYNPCLYCSLADACFRHAQTGNFGKEKTS